MFSKLRWCGLIFLTCLPCLAIAQEEMSSYDEAPAEEAVEEWEEDYEEPSFALEVARDFGAQSPLMLVWFGACCYAIVLMTSGRTGIGLLVAAASLLHLFTMTSAIVAENFIWYGSTDDTFLENGEVFMLCVDFFAAILYAVGWILLLCAIGRGLKSQNPSGDLPQASGL